ncbi:MAG: glycosyltransferase family 4 protein [Planctomycetes bacterium]|nr:glycosyltransferase family 4 protein [Planctomycetota bacterium]
MKLVLVANARIPSQRAQSIQLMHTASAFQRAGASVTLLAAERRKKIALPDGQDVFSYYGVPANARPKLETAPCVDWVDGVPVLLQYFPARLQELTFARNAATQVLARHAQSLVYSREIESARHLVRRGLERVFLELHRVPGGQTRRRWLREAARGVRGVVAISGGVREDLIALGVDGEKIRVEHDALDPQRFRSPPKRDDARAELGLAAKRPVVVYTGGLLAWKGADLLIDVARALPSVQFVIAGGMDKDVERLKLLSDGVANLRIDGFQPPTRVPLYLAAADVTVVPNRSEPAISAKYTSPLKIFEAMAVGLPIVASDLPSIREILEHERDALLVAPDSAEPFVRGIERLLGDDALRAKLRARLLERAPENTWDARARRLLAWMELAA